MSVGILSGICECPECVSARAWIVAKTGVGGGPRPLSFLITSHEQMARERKVAEDALAAARRECELWQQIAGDLYTPLEERGFKCEPRMDGSHISVCGTFSAENCPFCVTVALAAPAAGEEGKR